MVEYAINIETHSTNRHIRFGMSSKEGDHLAQSIPIKNTQPTENECEHLKHKLS